MSAARKKWRVKKVPGFTYHAVPSKKAAYSTVDFERASYALGISRTHEVNVEVNEGDSFGWVLYERIVFPVPLNSRSVTSSTSSGSAPHMGVGAAVGPVPRPPSGGPGTTGGAS